MSPMIQARPGFVVYDLNEPVAANQDIRKGDLVIYDAEKRIVKADPSEAKPLGFAVHSVTTGATVTERDRVIVNPFHSQSLTRITLANGVTLDRTLIGQSGTFVDEGGELRLQPGSGIARIVEIVERGIPTKDAPEVYIEVPEASRVRNGA